MDDAGFVGEEVVVSVDRVCRCRAKREGMVWSPLAGRKKDLEDCAVGVRCKCDSVRARGSVQVDVRLRSAPTYPLAIAACRPVTHCPLFDHERPLFLPVFVSSRRTSDLNVDSCDYKVGRIRSARSIQRQPPRLILFR